MANKILIKSSQDTGDGAAELYNSGGTAKLSVAELAINSVDGILFAGTDATAAAGTLIGATTDVYAQPLVVHTDSQAVGKTSTVQFNQIELGHATDTTLARASAGVLNLQGSAVATAGHKLDHFSATTSAELAGVLSDETGTGAFVLAGSPTLTGNPVAPTQSAGNNSTRLATTAFVTAAADAAAAGLQVHTDVKIASGTHDVTCSLTAGDATVTCSAAPISLGELVTTDEDGVTAGSYVATINAGTEGVSVTSFEMNQVAAVGADTSEVLTFTMDLTTNWTYDAGGKTLTHDSNQIVKLQGQTLVVNDRVLLKNQTAPLQNGVYLVSQLGNASSAPTILTRDTNMDVSADFINAFVFVTSGNLGDVSVNDTSWVTTVDTDFAYATDAVTFGQFNGPGNMTAGTNMTKVGNSLNVDDAFLTNDASDSMSGTLTATGFTTGNSGIIKFMDGDGTHYTTIAAHGTTTTSEAYTLPAADGTSGQVLSTDGNGVMSWASAATGDVTDVIGGLGLDSDANSGDITLDLNLHELVAETVASGDFIPFVDSTDNGTHKESIDDIATLMAGASLTATNAVLAVDDDFVKNTTDTMTDATAGLTTLTIDKNFSETGASTVKGIFVDIDKTATTTSDNTIYGVDVDVDYSTANSGTNTMIGLRATPRMVGAADAGTLTTKGAIITATGDTNGTSVATGMELTATGADTNNGLVINCADGGTDLKLVSSADATDYATLTVGASGATTLTTVDAGAAVANLTLTIDGSLIVAGDTGIDISAVGGAGVSLGLSTLDNVFVNGGSF